MIIGGGGGGGGGNAMTSGWGWLATAHGEAFIKHLAGLFLILLYFLVSHA